MARHQPADSHSVGGRVSTDDMRPRATRYEFGAVILYRQVGECSWREGWTVNVSRTGVLFTAPPPGVALKSSVEMIVVLPDFGAGGISRIRCTGQIVRTGEDRSDGRVVLAATIEEYRFLKPTEAASLETDLAGRPA
jgi:hypothetical protein